MKYLGTTKLIFFVAFAVSFHTSYAQSSNDCANAIVVCGGGAISSNATGVGTQELTGLNNCSSQENNSLWLKVNIVSDGNLGFILTPTDSDINIDYDFFVFGPSVTCGNLGQAIRCSTTNPNAAGQGNNLTGMTGDFTDTSEGPGPNGDSFIRWLDVKAGESYFIVIDRPIGNSPFSLEWIGSSSTGGLNELSDPPIANKPGDLQLCAQSANVSFDISAQNSVIIGTQSGVTLTYHETIADATEGINDLPSNYVNTTNPQTIYARVSDNSSECFSITDFLLEIVTPPIGQPENFVLCASDSSGFATFDLNTKNPEILNSLNPTDYNISYHIDQTGADTGNNPLSLNYTNTSSPQNIFVRLEEAVDSNCYATTSFNLISNPLPEIITGQTLEQCDTDNDGIGNFNLNEAYDLLANKDGYDLRFFTSNADMLSETNTLETSIPFQNTSNPQQLFVLVTTPEGCSLPTNFFLSAIGANLGTIGPLVSCEDSDSAAFDGNALFDLENKRNEIRAAFGLALNISLTFYTSLADAEFEANPLPDNLIAASSDLWVRAEGGMQNCQGIEPFQLIVNELPNPDLLETYQVCLNLLPAEPLIVDGGFFDSYQWRSEGSTDILGTDPSFMITEGGTYSLTVLVLQNGLNCERTETFTVTESNIATFTDIQINDGSANNTVVVSVSGEGSYEYALDSATGTYQDSNIFSNVAAGLHTVFVRDKNNCGIVKEGVSVIGFPKFFTPNGDGFNDTWQILGVSDQFQPNTIIYIFDRFGRLLKQLSPLNDGWDGIINGKLLPSADYWFSTTLQDGRNLKGHFSLKR